MTPAQLDALFVKVEQAIDAHPLLRRLSENPVLGSPTLHMCRLGCTVEIPVKLKTARANKRASEIMGRGETPESAADNLIEQLDNWATVL